jgi:sulfoxide reductase catalytic subunit YedY
MLGQRNRFAGEGVDYPYVKDLTIYEAINRFVWKILPPQNSPLIRLVVPYKYSLRILNL